tara:strand:+ start:534 stop:974 length:441 start_codon:yes stop_codon:yes gene_type:complete
MSLERTLKRLQILAKTNRAELAMAVSMLGTTTERIFEKGLDASGSSIGTYSAAYMKQRQKDNYPSSTKVILEATTQTRNDFSVINDGKKLGLGFKNSSGDKKNPGPLEKANFAESTYKKKIFQSTKGEAELAVKVFNEQVTRILNG